MSLLSTLFGLFKPEPVAPPASPGIYRRTVAPSVVPSTLAPSTSPMVSTPVSPPLPFPSLLDKPPYTNVPLAGQAPATTGEATYATGVTKVCEVTGQTLHQMATVSGVVSWASWAAITGSSNPSGANWLPVSGILTPLNSVCVTGQFTRQSR